MSRSEAINRAAAYLDSGRFKEDLKRRVAHKTESQNEDRTRELTAFLLEEMAPGLEKLGFEHRLLDNPVVPRLPMLAARRMEGPALPTILIYGHGDTVRAMAAEWREGLSPFELKQEGDRLYGRGAADNKGQLTINLGALAAVLEAEGRLGFNAKLLIEMGEEMGSPGLSQVCDRERDLLSADALIASDGPRFSPDRPTVFGGSRGVGNFDLTVDLREGAHHSGNWGGLLANPGTILANAIACLVDGRGRVLVPELRPREIPESVKEVLKELEIRDQGDPAIDPDWGEPGLTLAEKVFGWSTLEVLAFICGRPEAPANAIPPRAQARIHCRFVAGQDFEGFQAAMERRLEEKGFGMVKVTPARLSLTPATRLDPDNPWARVTLASLEKTLGKKPVFLPNLGGTIPNSAFAQVLGMPTIWVPHSYGGCSQHAPNEHMLASIAREGLQLMAGLFWDLGHGLAPR